jgi:hypothetical protein
MLWPPTAKNQRRQRDTITGMQRRWVDCPAERTPVEDDPLIGQGTPWQPSKSLGQ